MEIRHSLRTVPSRAIALVIAALAVLALALTTWYALGARPQSASPVVLTAPIAGEQISHNRSEEGLGGVATVGGEQVAHNRSEEGLSNR